jgi:hypothetical protein
MDLTHYINIYTTGDARHDGRAASVSGRSNYRLYQAKLELAAAVNPTVVSIDGLEIHGYNAGTTVTAIVNLQTPYDSGRIVFKNNIIHDCLGRASAILINAGSKNNNGLIYNNIIYNFPGDYSRGISNVAIRGYCVNNTVYKVGTNVGQTTYGYGIWGNWTYLKNNISVGNGGSAPFDYVAYTGSANLDYNISSDSSAAGTNSLTSQTAANLFVNITAGSEDLHLKIGANAIDEGTDLSGTFTTDIDGVTRSGTWDIGADEYAIASSTFLQQEIWY